MVDLKILNLSEPILSKLKEKKVKELTELDGSLYTAIEEGSSINADGAYSLTPVVLSLVKKLETKKLKTTRTPKAIVIAENAEQCQKFIDEFKSIISKELVAVSCHSKLKMKKNKKLFESATDVIVGEAKRINELVSSDSFKLKTISLLVILSAEKVINEESSKFIDAIIEKLPEKSLDASANESESKLQFVVIYEEGNDNIKSFIAKHLKNCVSLGEEESEEESSEESEEETKVVEVNGKAESSEEESSEEEKSDDESSSEEKKSEEEKSKAKETEEKMEVEEDVKSTVADDIATKIKSVTEFSEYEATAKKLIDEDGDVKSLARAFALIAQKTSVQSKPTKKTNQVIHTGEGSKLTGRSGYTAYLFKTTTEAFSKGYLFKGLKRHIEEELVESIERVQQSTDKMQFVFDLPSQHDTAFQGSWSDGKYDSLELLEGELPELLPADYRPPFDSSRGRGGSDRGGRGGRGGFERGGRGGFERGGRGGSRGGFEGRGRGGGDRGAKRPYSGAPGSAAKVQKFE